MVHNTPEPDPLALLTAGAAALGLELAPATLGRLQTYLEELKLWNARINLTGLKTDRDIVIKHFLDSLAVLPFLDEADSLVDLGSGAGFPGLVLKLARPHVALTLMEARQKKAAFLEYLAARFGLTGVQVVQTHLTPNLAEKWQPKVAAVVSRAAFFLLRLLELAAPLLAPGGMVLALKGVHLAPGELEAAGSAAPRLGLGPLEKHQYSLPISGEPRLLVMARKL
ncbi:MAG: 16S rRNA (guanine(527)-N(7))-methyltransferase RsmG [Deltaproteobacteria bacterium CG07_land_8_20_14_0_80_60_11]|nr:MAG: 16S rRNA (guanine(527)-N(7))-methyltransferase RsmG [Deltaproteobacteria bacterium CG07_land_8_20_14_0_80_60_11]